MSDDKIREAILNGLHKENPLGALFKSAERNRQAEWIMDELKPVLRNHRFNEGDPTYHVTPDKDGWREAYNQLCSDLAYMLGMEDASIAGDHQVKDRVAEIRDFVKRQTFAVLWQHTPPSDYPDTSVRDWMTFIAWPALLPGHCLRCHGFANKPCGEDDYGHGICPACVQDEGEG